MSINYYSYQDLYAAATAPGATQEDVNALGEWFEQFGWDYWTGEAFRAADDELLYPIYRPREDYPEDFEIVGYEFR